MARKISFTRAEKAALEGILSGAPSPDVRALGSLLRKMEAAEAAPERAPGLGWKRFSEIAAGELGGRFAPPPGTGHEVRLSTRIRDAGVTEGDLVEVCRWVLAQRHPYWAKASAEKLLGQWAELVAKARDAAGDMFPSGSKAAGKEPGDAWRLEEWKGE